MTEITMPPICVDCQRVMYVHEIGITIVELTAWNGVPYRIYSVDILRCPKCYKLVTFGNGKVTRQHDDDFQKELDDIKNLDIAKVLHVW